MLRWENIVVILHGPGKNVGSELLRHVAFEGSLASNTEIEKADRIGNTAVSYALALLCIPCLSWRDPVNTSRKTRTSNVRTVEKCA